MKLAVIPARGGSKRIPRKNIKLFGGQPMITWSIQAAKASALFDHIIVSTDDEQIAAIARQSGVDSPFKRPAELSDDHTPTVPVIAHALNWAENNLGEFEEVCCIYATAPFIQTNDLKRAEKKLDELSVDYCFPVTSFAFPIQRGIRITECGKARMLYPEHAFTRSQDLEESFHDAGQFYWGKRDAWAHGLNVMGENSAPIVIDRYRVQDIDTPEDWKQAELLFQQINYSGQHEAINP